MKENVPSLYLNVRQRPIWLLVGLILLGILLSLIRAPLFEGVPSPPVSAPEALRDLPGQLASSWLRMLVAYFFAILFAIFIGTLAATNEVRGRFLLPMLDILQSIPILGFFPTAIAWFMSGSGEQRVGIEFAAIFLIFTSQSWNLAFGVYDGIKSVPTETKEALKSLGLGPLALFRRLFLPAVLPRLVDNSILSWSNGWYFLMACEIISLGPQELRLPGLGAYLSYSIDHHLWLNTAIGISALILLILAMDIFIWKPLSALASQYRFESSKNDQNVSQTGLQFLNFYRNSRFFFPLRLFLNISHKSWRVVESFLERPTEKGFRPAMAWTWTNQLSLALIWGSLIAGSLYAMMSLISALVPPYEISPLQILFAVLTSALRITIAYLISIAWIIPLVYWLGQNPKLSRIFKSGAQVMASIPATAFFPLIAVIALNIFSFTEIAVTLLLLTGMQWYLLFNVLGGASALPNDIREAATALGVKKGLYIRKVFLPSIAPALVTGSITAVGGGWNALIISEYFKLDGQVQSVFGIGSILAKATYEKSDARLMSLSLFIMVAFILIFNRFFWQRLYKWSERKFRLEG
jgi:NitT/TauT family transport system permease protein